MDFILLSSGSVQFPSPVKLVLSMRSLSSVCTIHVFLWNKQTFFILRMFTFIWGPGSTVTQQVPLLLHKLSHFFYRYFQENDNNSGRLDIIIYSVVFMILAFSRTMICVFVQELVEMTIHRWLVAVIYFLVQCFYCWNKDVPFERMYVCCFY